MGYYWSRSRNRGRCEISMSKAGSNIHLLCCLCKMCIHSHTGKVLIITGNLTASWFYWGLVNYAGIAPKIWDKLRERSESTRRWLPCQGGRSTKPSLNALRSWESVITPSFCLKICSKAVPSWLDYRCQHLIYRQLHLGFTKKMEQQHSSLREALSKPNTGRQQCIHYKLQHTSHLH